MNPPAIDRLFRTVRDSQQLVFIIAASLCYAGDGYRAHGETMKKSNTPVVKELVVPIAFRRPTPEPLPNEGVTLVSGSKQAEKWFDAETVARLTAAVDLKSNDLVIVSWLKRPSAVIEHELSGDKDTYAIVFLVTAPPVRRADVVATRVYSVPVGSRVTFRSHPAE